MRDISELLLELKLLVTARKKAEKVNHGLNIAHADALKGIAAVKTYASGLADQEQAIAVLKRAHDIYATLLDLEQKGTEFRYPRMLLIEGRLACLNNRGSLLTKNNEFHKGMELFKKAHVIAKNSFGRESAQAHAVIFNCANAMMRQGEIENAAKLARKASSLAVDLYCKEDDRVASCYRLEGAIAFKQGNFAKTIKMNEAAMDIIVKQWVPSYRVC